MGRAASHRSGASSFSGDDLAGRPGWQGEAFLFCLLALLGTAAIFLSVKIPHTEVFVEGRWAFGFLGFALLRRWWSALFLACVLSIPYLSEVPFAVGFFGNLSYAVPALAVLRPAHGRLLLKKTPLWAHTLLWFLLVLVCYQAFLTPVVWAVLAMLEEAPLWPSVMEGWRLQPYLVESLLVGIVSAAGIAVVRSHRELQQSRRELAVTLDSIGDGVIATDTRGRVTRMNPKACELTGRPLKDALGRPLEEVFPIYDARTMAPLENPVERVLREGVVLGLANHTTLVALDGTSRQIADSAAPIHEAGGRLMGAVLVFRDVTEEYAARSLLRKKEELLNKSEALAHIGSWEMDGATGRLLWSDEVYRIFGLAPQEFEATYEGFLERVHPEDRKVVDEAYSRSIREKDRGYEIEHRIVRRDSGQVRIVHEQCEHEWDDEGTFLRSVGWVQDITHRRRAEAEQQRMDRERREYEARLGQMQKMESIGRLAGGVAHDLNNLLSPILGYGEMLLSDLPEKGENRDLAQEIVSAGCRARDLVRQLLAFSRKQPLAMKVVDTNEVLDGFKNLLRRTLREDIALSFSLAPDLPAIRADVGQLEQVIMNLATNAQDAMPDGGHLTIESGAVDLDEEYARGHQDVRPGRHVMLAVSDTGEGIDSETHEQIFEPFFTTKEMGRGTGLGLATVYGIIKQHGGNIWVYSEPGRGATFKCYFPVVEDPDAFPEEPFREPPDELRGEETVMVVEDNEAVQKMVVNALERQGYSVIAASSGDECLRKLGEHAGPVHLLLTDVVMPDMNGKELFHKIAPGHPEMRLIYASGYTDDVIARHGVLEEGIDFIQKPFSMNGLALKVREVLDRE